MNLFWSLQRQVVLLAAPGVYLAPQNQAQEEKRSDVSRKKPLGASLLDSSHGKGLSRLSRSKQHEAIIAGK